MSTNTKLYDQDFYAWTQTTAALIRAGKWNDLDREALAEEIESVGKSHHRELGNRLDMLVTHLLQWRYQPAEHPGNWRRTIRTHRRALRRLLAQNPSLRPVVASVIADSYAEVRLDASDATGLPLTTFPDACPWTPEQILETEFWPEGETHCPGGWGLRRRVQGEKRRPSCQATRQCGCGPLGHHTPMGDAPLNRRGSALLVHRWHTTGSDTPAAAERTAYGRVRQSGCGPLGPIHDPRGVRPPAYTPAGRVHCADPCPSRWSAMAMCASPWHAWQCS